MPLRIFYIGNFRHDFCTEQHLSQELRALGHDVTIFQEPSNPNDGRRFLDEFESWCNTNQPDLVLFTRTWGLPPEATQLWRRLEARGIWTASYHLDLYVGLKRQAGIEDDPFWTTQHVFTPDGDPLSADFFARHGINHHWSPPAIVSTGCYPGTSREEFAYDVVFVGSEDYHREWPWRPKLIQFLRERYGRRFRRFSGDCPEGPIREEALNDLYTSAKVVVGDSLCLPGHTHYWSDRYFETVGRGGFLIAPFVEGLQDFFVDGEHLRFYEYGKLTQIADLVDYYLAHQDEARQIAQQGQAHVRDHHTYQHRLAAALEVMGLGRATNVAAPVRGPTKYIDKLELGAGFHPTPGFTTLDLNPGTNPDIVGSAWPLDLPDGSVGELRAVDVLEHESWTHTDAILADWFRVLAPGGKLYVQVPDAHKIMRWYAGSPHLLLERLPANVPQTPLAGAAWRLLGGHGDDVYANDADWRFNAHNALFSRRSLEAALVNAGFTIDVIDENGHPNLLAWARKP